MEFDKVARSHKTITETIRNLPLRINHSIEDDVKSWYNGKRGMLDPQTPLTTSRFVDSLFQHSLRDADNSLRFKKEMETQNRERFGKITNVQLAIAKKQQEIELTHQKLAQEYNAFKKNQQQQIEHANAKIQKQIEEVNRVMKQMKEKERELDVKKLHSYH